jgi:hypothetical protein
MGSNNFANTGFAKTAQEAYNDLCDRATWEHGHDPYNGTISTTFGFTVQPISPAAYVTQKRITQKAIDRWLERAWDNTDKHTPCWCLELPKSHAKGRGRGVKAYLFAGWANS